MKKKYFTKEALREARRKQEYAWREKNREKHLEIKRKSYYKNKKWKELPVEKRLLYASRARATRRGLEFNLSLLDIQIPKRCPYLGIELVSHNRRGSPRANSASLDRIDNSKGYIKGNVEVISQLANTMKSSATNEQLISFSKRVLENAPPHSGR